MYLVNQPATRAPGDCDGPAQDPQMSEWELEHSLCSACLGLLQLGETVTSSSEHRGTHCLLSCVPEELCVHILIGWLQGCIFYFQQMFLLLEWWL